MNFQIVTEPIDRWPLPNSPVRPYPPFTATYDATILLLERELDSLGAKGRAVLQVVTRNGASDIRKDGLLRAQARIEHPGVRLSFESKHGSLTYATDRFDGTYNRPGWQANLRAIALSLEALRKVDRYGVSKSGEQYRGWQALEAGEIKLTEAQAMGVLREHAGQPFASHANQVADLWRAAKANTHPDRNGGMRGPWDDVERAAKALGLL